MIVVFHHLPLHQAFEQFADAFGRKEPVGQPLGYQPV